MIYCLYFTVGNNTIVLPIYLHNESSAVNLISVHITNILVPCSIVFQQWVQEHTTLALIVVPLERWEKWQVSVGAGACCYILWPAVSTDETSYEAGIKVQIHSQDEPPFIDQLGFGVAPGFQTFVSCQQQLVPNAQPLAQSPLPFNFDLLLCFILCLPTTPSQCPLLLCLRARGKISSVDLPCAIKGECAIKGLNLRG